MQAVSRTATEERTRAMRRWVCVATVVACTPYLALKVAWVAGASVGTTGGDFAETTRVANLATAGLEAVAIAIAVLFVHPLGRRVPAFLVLLPAWAATGLLGPVVLGVLLGAPAQVASGGGNPFTGDDVLAPWVFAAVYGGFTLQAALLAVGFTLYARDRWPVVLGGGAAPRTGATWPLQQLLGGVLAVTVLVFAGQQLVSAVTAQGTYVADPTTAQRVMLAASGVVAVLAGVAALDLLRGHRLTAPRLVLVWAGSAVTFTASLNETLRNVAIDPDEWGASTAGPGAATLSLLVLLGSLGGAIGGAIRLAEEQAGRSAELDEQVAPGDRVAR